MDTKNMCLGVLTLGDFSGYEIKKFFEEGPFSHFYDAGFGSIYPALNQLLERDLVTCREVVQDGRPAKKVYSITDAGRLVLRDALHQAPAKDKIRSDHLVMMFFGHLLAADQRQFVIDHYISHFSAGLEALQCSDLENASDSRKFVHGLGTAIYRTALAYLEEGRDKFLASDEGEEETKPKSVAGEK